MKYKLINKQTGEETFCDKVTIDCFDYYVNEETPKLNDAVITASGNIHYIKDDSKDFIEYVSKLGKKLIATNNPNIDVPKVVDEDLGLNYLMSLPNYEYLSYWVQDMIKKAYNKSQETHPFSEKDMIEFVDFVEKSMCADEGYTQFKTNKELLQLWKEQQPKIIYYE